MDTGHDTRPSARLSSIRDHDQLETIMIFMIPEGVDPATRETTEWMAQEEKVPVVNVLTEQATFQLASLMTNHRTTVG